MKRLLILGGTRDASKLATKINQIPNLDIVYSLAGRTQTPNIPLCKTRAGGFGGISGLANYLKSTKIDFVIDATHPFAEIMAANTAAACIQVNIPRIKFCRRPWKPRCINWISVPNYIEAIRTLRPMGKRIFLSIGTKKLTTFSALTNKWFLIRAIEKPTHPISFRDYKIILDRGPFKEMDEHTLLTRHQIDVLVSKNSGGETATKLQAAHSLGIPILMIEQPQPPVGKVLYTIDEIPGWINDQI
jgi:precorrin-6A/cobalt-precorrin-6A reductase